MYINIYIYIIYIKMREIERGCTVCKLRNKILPQREGYNFPGTTGSHRLLEKICKIAGR